MLILNNAPGVEVVMRPAAIEEITRSPTGPVFRFLVDRATLVQEAARRQVRLGHIAAGGRIPLRYTILKRVIPDAVGGPVIRVGSESPIALLHHEGTRPHLIVPRNARVLRWLPPTGGGFVYVTRVHHPGTAPNHYLTDNLHLAVAGLPAI